MMRLFFLVLFLSTATLQAEISTQLNNVHRNSLNLLEFNTKNESSSDYFCSKISNSHIEYQNSNGETLDFGEAFISDKMIFSKSTNKSLQENTDYLSEVTSILETELFPVFKNEDIQYFCEKLKSRLNKIFVLVSNNRNQQIKSFRFDPVKKSIKEISSFTYPSFKHGDKIFTSPFKNSFYRLTRNAIYKAEFDSSAIKETLIYQAQNGSKLISFEEYESNKFILFAYNKTGIRKEAKHFIEGIFLEGSAEVITKDKVEVPILTTNLGIGPIALSDQFSTYADDLKVQSEQLLEKNISGFLTTLSLYYKYNKHHSKIEVTLNYRDPIFRMLCGIKWNNKKRRYDLCKAYDVSIKTSPLSKTTHFIMDTNNYSLVSNKIIEGIKFEEFVNSGNYTNQRADSKIEHKGNLIRLTNNELVLNTRYSTKTLSSIRNSILLFSDKIVPLPKLDIDSFYKGRPDLTHQVKSTDKDSYEKALELITNGAKVNLKDFLGKTPLHYAVGKREPEKLELLLQNMADPNATDRRNNTPLHLELTTRFNLKNNLTSTYYDFDSFLPSVQLQIINSSKKTIETLLKYGANPHLKNKDQNSFVDLLNSDKVPVQLRNHFSSLKNSSLKQEDTTNE